MGDFLLGTLAFIGWIVLALIIYAAVMLFMAWIFTLLVGQLAIWIPIIPAIGFMNSLWVNVLLGLWLMPGRVLGMFNTKKS